jgi:hypothetical protein
MNFFNDVTAKKEIVVTHQMVNDIKANQTNHNILNKSKLLIIIMTVSNAKIKCGVFAIPGPTFTALPNMTK